MAKQHFRFCALVLLACLFTPVGLEAQESAVRSDDVLRRRLEQLAASFPGKVGIFARNIETGAEAGVNAGDQFPMASTYKVAIMVQVFRDMEAGRLSLGQRIPLGESDRRLGSGLLPYMNPGLNPTLHDLLLLMITLSDNEATDLLLKRVGAANVTATLRQLGIQNMRVDRSTEELIGDWLSAADPSFRGLQATEFLAHPEKLSKLSHAQIERADRAFVDDPRDHTSPRAMADLLTKIFRAEAASEKSCRDMLDIMQQQQLRTRIHRYLEDVTIASKNGTIGYVTNDVGILYAGKQHIVLSIYTLKANSEVTTEQAEECIARIARAAYDYFEDAASVR
jgi:beta-lactamase class A